MRILATIAAILLLPALGLAQVDAPRIDNAAPIANLAPAGSEAVMPLWSTSDGRVLALIAMGDAHHGAPVLPQSPQVGSAADWQLIDVTHFVGAGLSLRLGNRINAFANFGRGIVLKPLNSAAYSIGCNFGLAAASLCTWRPPAASTGQLRMGATLSTDKLDLGVTSGVTWLRRNPATTDTVLPMAPWDVFTALNDSSLPTLALPALQLANLRDVGIDAQGRWHLNESQTFDLGAALSRIELDLPGNALAPVFNQAALSFGVHSGNFSGTITGRVIDPVNAFGNAQNWTSLDLGFSWRAPWRGVFSVGAQNLWSSGSPPQLALPKHESDPGQARVPYVQYHQDL